MSAFLKPLKEWLFPVANCCRRNFVKEKAESNVEIHYLASLNEVSFRGSALIAHHAQLQNVQVGDRTSIGRYTKVRDCEIGKYCSISWDTTLGAVAHPMETITSCALTYRKFYGFVDADLAHPQLATVIGNDVWIGCGVTVVSGVCVGNGSVIGAGAVVTKDVPPYAIAAGVPARIIGWRFEEKVRALLDGVRWWDWPDSVISEHLALFKEAMSPAVADRFAEIQRQVDLESEEGR